MLLSLRAIMNWGVPSLELRDMLSIVERHPRVPWILSGINYLQEIRSALLLLRRYPSVYFETSCVMGYEAIQKAVKECGHEQILFGSAAPLQHGRADLEKVLHARIGDRAREAILAGNATRLLGLENEMRFVRFFQDDEPHLGLRQGDRVFDLTAANEELRGNRLTSVTQLMGHQISQDVLTRLMAFATSEERFAHRRGDLRLDAPFGMSRNCWR